MNIASTEFKSSILGYNKEEVKSYMRKVQLENEKELNEKEREIAEITRKNIEADAKIKELQERIEEIYSQKSQIADILLKVEEKAEEVEKETIEKCEKKKRELDIEISKKVDELNKIKLDISQLQEEVVNLLNKYKNGLQAVQDFSEQKKEHLLKTQASNLQAILQEV